MIDTMGVAGTAQQVRDGLRRYEGVLHHIMLYPPSVAIPPEQLNKTSTPSSRELPPQ
jgi:hypothetical protein